MQMLTTTLRGQWIGILAVFLLLGGAAAAATGDFVQLGGTNEADHTTSIRNTDSGAALRLLVAPDQAPLTVNSAVEVANLNASRLGGRRAGDFAPAKGSPNYEPAGQPQLLMAVLLGGFQADPGQFFRRTLVAPAAGSVYLTLLGECTVNNQNVARLGIYINGSGHNAPWGTDLDFAKPAKVGCSETTLYEARAGEKLVVTSTYRADKGDPKVYSVFLQVTFDPTPLDK